MNKIMEQAIAIKEDIVSYRRTIHANPEVGAKLPMTKKFVMDKLKEFGYEPEEICESGIVATISGPKPGKTFLLRADMDALPMEEHTGCDFASTNGNMHSCGHDMHSAMLLGAARLLKQNQDEIEGTIKLVFQPDEEGFTGAKTMIKAGVLKNPDVDAALAMHVNSGTPSDLLVFQKGPSIGGCFKFRIVVKGDGCHGAFPEKGIDPINIAHHIYSGIKTILVREISGINQAVITIGKFVGGDTPNIIPDEAVMEGTLRYLQKETGDFIIERMKEIVTSTAKTFRGEAEFIELSSVPPLDNDSNLVDEISEYMKEIFGEESILVFEGGGMGSEDFASYSYEVPSIYITLGAGTKNENPEFGEAMHSPKVVFNEDILPKGAAIHTYSAITWLKNNK